MSFVTYACLVALGVWIATRRKSSAGHGGRAQSRVVFIRTKNGGVTPYGVEEGSPAAHMMMALQQAYNDAYAKQQKSGDRQRGPPGREVAA